MFAVDRLSLNYAPKNSNVFCPRKASSFAEQNEFSLIAQTQASTAFEIFDCCV